MTRHTPCDRCHGLGVVMTPEGSADCTCSPLNRAADVLAALVRDERQPSCCRLCEDAYLRNVPHGWALLRFIVCSECGNKRCPKASACWQECTDSNEPGQVGSFYGPEEHWPTLTSRPQ